MPKLSPEAAHIFRITHVNNLPWILRNGLHCRTSGALDPAFVPIGLPELIQKRAMRSVPIAPNGQLGDYVPFYFTPWSVMMLNIKSGRNGVIKRTNREIGILVSSMHRLDELGIRFIFTNGHAYMQETDYFNDLGELVKIDWDLLLRRDFKHDPEDPGKLGRYQAEALVHRHVPVEALLGIACYNTKSKAAIQNEVEQLGLAIAVKVIEKWYF